MLDLILLRALRRLYNISHLPDLVQALTHSPTAAASCPQADSTTFCITAVLPSLRSKELSGGEEVGDWDLTKVKPPVSGSARFGGADQPGVLRLHLPTDQISRSCILQRRYHALSCRPAEQGRLQKAGFSASCSRRPRHAERVGDCRQGPLAPRLQRRDTPSGLRAGHYELGTPSPRRRPPTSRHRGIAARREKGNGKVVT